MKDRILQELSQGNPWGHKLHYVASTSSTNDALKQMASQGADHGTVLVADMQTGGRGRMGRSFQSPPGVGVYISVLLRPDCRPENLMHLTCAAACATCDAIERSVGFRPGIKWTNDIVFRNRKLAGILTEMALGSHQQVDYAIVGIGINCCQKREDFAPEIQSIAGSLAMETGREVDRAKVAAAMMDSFFQMDRILLSNKHDLLDRYRRDCITLGQDISIFQAGSIRHGRAVDLDENGALIVQFPGGICETVNSGEVSVRGLYGYL